MGRPSFIENLFGVSFYSSSVSNESIFNGSTLVILDHAAAFILAASVITL
jgi:hypothetical protein